MGLAVGLAASGENEAEGPELTITVKEEHLEVKASQWVSIQVTED